MSVWGILGLTFVGYNFVIPIARYSMLETGLTRHSTILSVLAGLLGYALCFPENISSGMGLKSAEVCVQQVATLLAFALSCYNFYTEIRGPKPPHMNLSGRFYLVTGANSGIGLETSRRLALDGAHVIMGCRSKARAQSAYDDIVKSLPSNCKERVEILDTPLDLGSMKSVKKYCDAIKAKGIPLNGIICNAGMIPSKFELTVDGIESGFASNHLGHFLLCQELLPLLAYSAELDKNDQSRIVILSSSLHKLASAKQSAVVATEAEFSGFPVYSRCKLANLLFMHGLIKFINTDAALTLRVTVNAVHPGNPCTNFTSNLNSFLRFGEAITMPLMYLVRETCYAGAFCSVFAATSPTLFNKNGLYLSDSAPATPNKESYNEYVIPLIFR